MKRTLSRLLGLSLLLVCSSSYSEEYQQQYEIGSTGPNGGVVTEVTVTSRLVDEVASQEGDFLEITYTYEYVETVVEDVENISFTTTTNATPVTTSNLVSTAQITDTNINIVGPQGNAYGMQGAEFTTGNQSQNGGTRVYTHSFDQENKQSVEYGLTVYSHSSNAHVPPCANATSDCRDDWSLTVRLYNDDELVDSISHTYTGINWVGSRDYSWTEDVRSVAFDYGVMELYGIDRGFNSGYYGPGFSDVYARLTYNAIEEIVNRVVTQVEMQSVNTTNVYVYDSIYNPQVVVSEVTIEPITETTFEVIVEAESFDTQIVEVFELEVEMDSLPTQIEAFDEINNMDTDIVEYESDVEVVEIEADTDSPEAEVEVVEETEPEIVEDTQEVEVAETSEPTEEPETKEQVETVKTKTSTYSPVMDSIKVALMVRNQSTVGFQQYQQQTIPDVSFYAVTSYDGGQNIDNPLGRWFVGASDLKMQEMVDSQWQR